MVRLTVAGLVLLVEAIGLGVGGKYGVLLVGLLMFVTVVALASRFDAGRAAVGMSYAACFTLAWNGWYVGGLHPGDVLVLIALMLFAIDAPDYVLQMPPWWVKQLVLAILLVAVLYILFPVDPSYLAHRVVLNGLGQPTVSTKGSIVVANIGVAFKFIVAVAALPIAFVLTVRRHRNAVYWLAVLFAGGTALSGLAAFAAKLGFNQITAAVTHLPAVSGRQYGFSLHPNFLAAGIVIATPFALWLLFGPGRRSRLLGAATTPFLVLGVYASGSRGGAVGLVIAVASSLIVLPRARQYAAWIIGSGLALAGAIWIFFPAVGGRILSTTRLTGPSITTSGSDIVRNAVAHQAILDLKHSPIWGIGLQVSTEAQNVYLQQLQSGGLLLFTAMLIYMVGGMVTAWRLIDRYHVAAAVFCSLLVTLAINYVEADLTDRFYYVPAAIIIALGYAHNRSLEEAAAGSGEPLTGDVIGAGTTLVRGG